MIATRKVVIAASLTFGAAVALYLWGYSDGRAGRAPGLSQTVVAAAKAPPGLSPVKARARDAYFPNSEDLAPDEMRVIACGTGMPTARPSQAAACFLVELGNGDKFIFDIGTGSAERLAALQIPYNYLDKVFLGHLHTDHLGDMDALFVGGALCGRQKPLQVYGPSGATRETGTAYAMDHLRKYVNWDITGRQGLVDERGYHIETHEFDYRKENQIVYR